MEKLNALVENKKLAYRIAMIILFLWGVAMSFLVPPWQVPDEMTHLRMIGYSLGADHMMKEFWDDINLDDERLKFHTEEKIDIELWKDALTKAPGYARADALPTRIHPMILKYFPAILGIELGVLFHLPTFWVLTLGELFSLAFYVSICALALRLMPYKKEVLLILMSFPMCLQQAASISYDSVLLPLCFLYIAYIFHLRMEKEQVGWSDLIKTLLLILFIAYIKIPYIFLILMVFLIPREKIYFKVGKLEVDGEFIRRWRVLMLLIAFAFCAIGIFLLRDNFWVRLVGGLCMEFRRTLFLLGNTLYYFTWYFMVSSVGMFGWLDSQLPPSFVWLTYIFLFFIAVWGEERKEQFDVKLKARIWIWVIFFVQAVFIAFSMINHTVTISFYGWETTEIDYNIREVVYQIPFIGGIQGRYFLPFLVLPFLALPTLKKKAKGKVWLVVLYQLVASLLTMMVLYKRYWVR